MERAARAGRTLKPARVAADGMRPSWGLWGLLGFEAILAAYAFANGALDYAAMALVAMVALGWALVATTRGGEVPKGALVLLVVVTLLRALWQTAVAGAFPPGVLPTFLVPVGFALLLLPRASPMLGLGLVAAARTWFIAWYFLRGSTTLALANLVGAVGAWLWLAEAARQVTPAPVEEGPATEARP